MKHNIEDDRANPSSQGPSKPSSTMEFISSDELERRRMLADGADRIRVAIGPLGCSAVDVIREFRDGDYEGLGDDLKDVPGADSDPGVE